MSSSASLSFDESASDDVDDEDEVPESASPSFSSNLNSESSEDSAAN